MEFNPRDGDSQYTLIPDGEYEAFVENATQGVSSNNDPMLTIVWEIPMQDGSRVRIYDRIVPKCLWKLKRTCESIGKSDVYETGKVLPEHLIHERALLKVGRDKGDGKYGPQNRIEGWYESKLRGQKVKAPKPEPVGAVNEQGIDPDDIPF